MPSGIYKRTEKCKENLSKSHLGKKGFWTGKKRPPFSKETRIKMGISQKKRAIEGRCPLWKHGLGRTSSRHYNDVQYKLWREEIFRRDNWTCRFCGLRSSSGIKVFLEPHHIKRWKDYPELRYKINNGLTLCRSCHKLTMRKETEFESICISKIIER